MKKKKQTKATGGTVAQHERFAALYKAWQERDFDVDNFELHRELVALCEECGWEIPGDLR